ncbi:hypothetical protein [Metaclostridioides mangenotii]|uniref:hypothetical protein n=1 Tax=Metaclostridioides mangenotii TaxID=1540 RepID=UPI00047F36E7|nr:hypothetical protein [Clostridioides mangenotii]
MANEMMRIFFHLNIITYSQGEDGLDESPEEITRRKPWSMRTSSSLPSLKRTDTLKMAAAL